MVIVHIIARVNIGGTANWVLTLTEKLRENGHQSTIFTGLVSNNEIEEPKLSKIGFTRIPYLTRNPNLISDIRSIIFLRKKIIELSPDIINTHTAKAGILGRLAAVGLGIPKVHTFHGHTFYGYFSPFKSKIIILFERLMSRITENYIAVGRQVRIDLIENRITESCKISVISPPLSQLTLVNRKILRESFGISNESFVVGVLGRITAIKRPDLVLEIAKMNPSIIFLLGGGGDLEEKFIDTNLSNVHYVGWCQPGEFWPACDLALLTSDNEGIPTSLIEAGSLGIPALARKVGSVADVLLEHKTGEFFENIDMANEILRRLASNQILLSNYSTNTKAYVEETFSAKNFYVLHENLYLAILANKTE
jgi:glycosyltransferase involved in cell wall biosynthesis